LIRILLDEHVSPSLVGKLGDKGVFAAAATHVGLSGEADAKIWNYAFENDFVVVTGDVRDFIRLLNVEVHPGLIVTFRPQCKRTPGETSEIPVMVGFER
jgi:predicted nuclease of predicted toxin-antitoxin system